MIGEPLSTGWNEIIVLLFKSLATIAAGIRVCNYESVCGFVVHLMDRLCKIVLKGPEQIPKLFVNFLSAVLN